VVLGGSEVCKAAGVRKTPHTAHKRRLTRGISCPKFNKQAGWPRRKNATAASSVGLALNSIWEKARARDGQRDVVGDKGNGALFCKG
jgi:hypothetical protein